MAMWCEEQDEIRLWCHSEYAYQYEEEEEATDLPACLFVGAILIGGVA